MNQPSSTTGGPDGIEVLNDLAKVFGVQVNRAKVMLTGGPTLTRQLRALYQRHQIELLVNQDFILADVKAQYGDFTLFHINPRVRPSEDPVRTMMVAGVKHEIFNYPGRLSKTQHSLIESGVLARLLGVIGLSDGEEINVSQQLVRVYLRRPTRQRVMAVIHAVIDLMPHVPDGKQHSAFAEFPDRLRPLVPLVMRWAISDDEERSRKVRRCAQSTRRRLVREVVPLVPAIDQYLDTFGTSPSEEACALGDLARAAFEARSFLAEESLKSDIG